MIPVDVLNSVNNLLEVELGLFLRDALILDVVEKFPVVGQLHDHEDIIVSI